MRKTRKLRPSRLQLESLEPRLTMNGAPVLNAMHNHVSPTDVDANGATELHDALMVVNQIYLGEAAPAVTAEGESPVFADVSNDGEVTLSDAIEVVNHLYRMEGEAAPEDPSRIITPDDADQLLQRAAAASASQDAIIAIVDRAGRVLGVRVEQDVIETIGGDNNVIDPGEETDTLVFAIDGAVAKARTAAFFSSDSAPLTSRTIRFISQSTITQREVESNPNKVVYVDPSCDPADQPTTCEVDIAATLAQTDRGPGFVAPIGVGGHFPPEVLFTPPVDLFAIEHQSRDSALHPGPDRIKGTPDDIPLANRFNIDGANLGVDVYNDNQPITEDDLNALFPESYGVYSGRLPYATSRGIATLPGGIPLYKNEILVGGIGVFFPGEDGFATHEQGFIHQADLPPGSPNQSEFQRNNAPKVLESEWIALAAAGGSSVQNARIDNIAGLPPVPGYDIHNLGRIDLVGITLEAVGPHPTINNRRTGLQTIIDVGNQVGRENLTAPYVVDPATGIVTSGADLRGTFEIVSPMTNPMTGNPIFTQPGRSVPNGWIVAPQDSEVDDITKEDVERIIVDGINEANRVRAAIRLTDDLQPGERTRMVLAVADSSGEVLGLFRMLDATIFSIDVSVAKARNTAYYSDPDAFVATDVLRDGEGNPILDGGGLETTIVVDAVDHNNDNIPDDLDQDGLPGVADGSGGALTNRTYRFLALPRFPSGAEITNFNGDFAAARLQTGAYSMLRDPGINPITAENLGPALPASVYSINGSSVIAYDGFNPSSNFRDPEDIANQNGVVFFPGSTPLYRNGLLVGGFGVSGDGVDQDDVVTFAGQLILDPPAHLKADQFFVQTDLGPVRLPYQKFLRNPYG